MKTTMLFFAFVLIAMSSIGQGSTHDSYITNHPEFKSQTLCQFLSKEIQYPEISKKWMDQGTVIIEFTVNPDGSLSNYRIINSVSPELDFQVLRAIVKSEGKWEPGSIDGKAVIMHKEVSVLFRLSTSDEYRQLAKSYFEKGNKFLFEKGNPEKALKFFDMACQLRPYDVSLLNSRILCKAKMGDSKAIKADMERLVVINERYQNGAHEGVLVVR